MTTAAHITSAPFSDADIELLAELRERFSETTKINARTRRERLIIIIEGFRLFQSHGGYNSEAAYELYGSLQIVSRVSDAQKAAMAITGENPSTEEDATEKNRMYGRVKTVAGILLELQKDAAEGFFDADDDDEIIDWINEAGGWREYGEYAEFRTGSSEAGANAEQADDGGEDENTKRSAASSKKAANDDAAVFDVAGCRTLIEQTGIIATLSSTIVAPTPRVALICGLDETNLSLMPLTGVPIDLLRQLQEYRPDPDEHATSAMKAWGHITSALQLFDRVDSSAPIDADVEPYAGQDMKPSLPGIACEAADRFIISASRQFASIVVSATLRFSLIGKGALGAHDCWIHGNGTKSLIRNLSSAEHRAAYLDPELVTGSSLKMRFKVRSNHGTDRKSFSVDLKAIDDVPSDYWLLAPRNDVQATSFANFDGGFASHTDLLRFAAAAGAAKSLKKSVKVAVSGAKELSLFLALGTSKRNTITGCSVTGAAVNCEVAAQDFARAIAFGQAIGAHGCQLAIDPNGLLLVNLGVDEIGEFQVAIPTFHEGKRERALLRRVPL